MKSIYRHIAHLIIATSFAVSAVAEEFELPIETDLGSTTLRIHKIQSKVEVIGTDESFIRLRVDKVKPLPEKAKGLRPLLATGTDNTGLGFELLPSGEDDSILVLRQTRRSSGSKIFVELPKQMALDFEAHINAGVSISGLEGEVASKTLNGRMIIQDVTGPLILNTVNGGIDVKITKLNQEFPSSIVSVNGEIDVEISESEKANLHLSVVNGEIYSNLEFDPKPDKGSMSKLIGSSKVNNTMNGGGVRLSITTVNGKIYLRKAE